METMSKRLISLFLGIGIIGLVVLSGLFLSSEPASADSVPTAAPEKNDYSRNKVGRRMTARAATDLFGYEVSVVAPAWIDAKASGTEIEFVDRDDDVMGPIPIGFNFPYYENTYSELYVTTNGMVTFGEPDDEFANRDIPRDTLPNNLVAPFWDDLLFVVDDISGDPISRAFYLNGSDGQGNYFVVEWYRVARLDTQTDVLTFEVVFRENGNIRFQYNNLSGQLDQATVGIEDDQGVDGSLYVYNSSGLNTSDAILFDYPAAAARTKIYPINRGGLTSSRITDLQFTVRNSGASGKDTYDLSMSAFDPDWTAVLLDGGSSMLTDTDGDGLVDTGPMAQGTERTIIVRVTAPEEAEVGENIEVVLSAASSLNPAKEAQATFQAAVPTSFALAMLQNEFVRLRLIWQENHISVQASPGQFFGSNLAVQRLQNGNYLYSWEDPAPIGSEVYYANLKFTILSDLGGSMLQETNLTDNSNAEDQTTDRFLVSDISPDGQVGVAWVRSISKWFGSGSESEFKTKQNVYFAVINENGSIVVPIQNITQNTEWRGEKDLDIPYFISPRIAATGNGRFVIAWRTNATKTGGEVDDVEYMVFAANGNQVKARTQLTSSQPDGIYYISPGLVDMAQNNVLLSYTENDPDLGTSSLVYQILDSSGSVVNGQTQITNSAGSSAHDAVRYSNVILLAWSSTLTGDVGFTLLDETTGDVVAPTQYMISPNLRDAKTVSVARDSQGHGIIVWADRMQDQFLYYALVSEDGTPLTPAMICLIAPDTFVTNSYGYGLASYEGTWQAFGPILAR